MIEHKFIDAHLHLQDERVIAVADQVIAQAIVCGVGSLLCNATSEADWQQVINLATDHQSVVPFLGVHPWQASMVEDGWQERLFEALSITKAGIGEIGLDKTAKGDAVSLEQVFIDQLQIAQQLQRPVTIHCIGRWGRLLELLKEFDHGACGLLIHSFGGSKEIMYRLLDLGAYISFPTMLADSNRNKMQQAYLAAPLDRILLETDSPDQYCKSLVGAGANEDEWQEQGLNVPAYIPLLYKYAANLRRLKMDTFSEAILNNGQIFTN